MGQKINALGLRLKKRVNWQNQFCVQNIAHHAIINSNIEQMKAVTFFIFSKFQNFLSNMIVNKTNKNFQLYAKILQRKDLISNPNEISDTARSELLKKKEQFSLLWYLNTSSAKFYFSNLLSADYRKTRGRLMLTPQLISLFLKMQLTKTNAIKFSSFKVNLKSGILLFCLTILKQLKTNVLGLKISCFGKWKKTKSGRKQKFTIKFGQVVTSKFSNVILFDSITQKTKFGVCCFKIWVAVKK